MSTHGFLWPYSISGLIRKYIDSITVLMTSEQGRGGKKGQHIFENVNLNNVFWVCWKKPLSNAIWLRWHVALCFSPTPVGIVRIFRISIVGFSLCQRVTYIQSMCLYFAICCDCEEYNGSHYFFTIMCPHVAFWKCPNDLEVMTFQSFCMYQAHFLSFSFLFFFPFLQHKLLYK